MENGIENRDAPSLERCFSLQASVVLVRTTLDRDVDGFFLYQDRYRNATVLLRTGDLSLM
jgi:hypothetical protein